MRSLILAAAVLGGAGCGGEEEPDVLCTATAAPSVRSTSRMDERGLPIATWTWDHRGFREHTTYRYDDLGRLVEQQVDLGGQQQEPDGKTDAITSIRYVDATAEVTTIGLSGGDSSVTTYELDGAGRPVRIVKELAGTDEIRAFQYDGEGRIAVMDERGLPGLPRLRHTAYTYGAGGLPIAMRATVDATPYDWVFEQEASPGRLRTRGYLPSLGLEVVHVYEHDADGRLLRAEHPAAPERNLEITYAGDGAVAVLVGGATLHTYSAECRVAFEVPRGPPAPRAPGPEGLYVLPEVAAPYVMPSLIPF